MNEDSPDWDEVFGHPIRIDVSVCDAYHKTPEWTKCRAPASLVVSVRRHDGVPALHSLCGVCLSSREWVSDFNSVSLAEFEIMAVMRS